jgi:restriction system protein
VEPGAPLFRRAARHFTGNGIPPGMNSFLPAILFFIISVHSQMHIMMITKCKTLRLQKKGDIKNIILIFCLYHFYSLPLHFENLNPHNMALPVFEDFLYPFLLATRSKDMTVSEMREYIVNYFHLTDEDCSLRTKNGNTTQVADRLNWVRQYLRRALMIELPQRGVYRITERGKNYLATHDSLNKKDLMEYPEFASYATGTNITKAGTEEKTNQTMASEYLTPTEQLEQAYHSINDDLAADLLQKTLEQSPLFFEHLVVDLLVKMGYGGSFANSAQVTQYVHDDGIDGIIYEDKLGLDKIYIQAKRYKLDNTVGKPQIQQFSGALDEQKATKGVFITTSSYSKEAKQYVQNLNKKIVLIDGQELARYMIEYNVGVSTKQVYEVKRIDSDYFEE